MILYYVLWNSCSSNFDGILITVGLPCAQLLGWWHISRSFINFFISSMVSLSPAFIEEWHAIDADNFSIQVLYEVFSTNSSNISKSAFLGFFLFNIEGTAVSKYIPLPIFSNWNPVLRINSFWASIISCWLESKSNVMGSKSFCISIEFISF